MEAKREHGELIVCTKKGWSDLPRGILELIIGKLHFIDQLYFRAVCKSWHSISQIPPIKEIPWLMVIDDLHQDSSCKLIDPTRQKTYTVIDMKIKEKKLYDMEVHESKYGWLLMSSKSCAPSGTVLLLYTPFLTRNNIIELPVLNSTFQIASFSTNPSSTSQEDCLFITLKGFPRHCVFINTYRRGDDTWTSLSFFCDFSLANVMSVVYYEGVFYCPTRCGSIGDFNVALEEWGVCERQHSAAEFLSHGDKRDHLSLIYMTRFVDDRGFLMAITNAHHDSWSCPWIHLFRLDLSRRVWEPIESLGNHSLFIGNGTPILMVAPQREWKNRIHFCLGPLFKCFDFIEGCCGGNLCPNPYESIDSQSPFKKIWIELPQ